MNKINEQCRLVQTRCKIEISWTKTMTVDIIKGKQVLVHEISILHLVCTSLHCSLILFMKFYVCKGFITVSGGQYFCSLNFKIFGHELVMNWSWSSWIFGQFCRIKMNGHERSWTVMNGHERSWKNFVSSYPVHPCKSMLNLFECGWIWCSQQIQIF